MQIRYTRKSSTRIIPAALIAILLVSGAAARADDQIRGVAAETKIHGEPANIYKSIREMGKAEGNVKVLEGAADHSLLEETFKGLPIIGDAVCVYEEKYDIPHRIDYHLIRSDKFKAFEGGWELVPVGNGDVSVKLHHYTDTGLRIPFARQITDGATKKDIEKRLETLKQRVESCATAPAPAASTAETR